MEPQDQLSSQESAESAAPSAGDSHGRALQISIVGVVLVLLFAVLVGFFTDFSLFRLNHVTDSQEDDAAFTYSYEHDAKGEELIFVISEQEVALDVGGEPVELTVTANNVDVTDEALWFSDDESVVVVGNNDTTKGRVVASGEGVTVVGAIYQGEVAEATVQASAPSLSVACYPSSAEVVVGERVEFVGLFNDIGVPNYTYVWSGDDGLTGNVGIIDWTYETVGVKNVNFTAYDQAGASASTNCTVTVVTN